MPARGATSLSLPARPRLLAQSLPVLLTPLAFLAVLLILRNLTDPINDLHVFGRLRLNPGSILGLAAVGYAGWLLVSGPQRIGLRLAAVVVAALTGWLLLGFLIHGVDAAMPREWFRLISIVAVGLIAANGRDTDPTRVAILVAISLLIPLLIAVVQLLLNLSQIGPEQSADFFRATGTFVQANKAGQSFVLALFLGLWALIERGRTWPMLFFTLAALVAILATRSLGGIAAGGVAALAYLLLRPMGTRWRIAIVLGALLFLAIFAISPFGASRIHALADTRLPWDVVGRTQNSFEWRLYNWWLLLGAWLQQPLFGHGLGATLHAIQPVDKVTHSDPVRLLVETGVVGLGLTVAGASVALAATRRSISVGFRRNHGLGLILLALAIGLGVQSFVQNTLSNTALMYGLAALFVSLWTAERKRSSVRTGGIGN